MATGIHAKEGSRARARARVRTVQDGRGRIVLDEEDVGRTELNGERSWQEERTEKANERRGMTESARKREKGREGKGSEEVEVDDLSILLSLHPMAMKEPHGMPHSLSSLSSCSVSPECHQPRVHLRIECPYRVLVGNHRNRVRYRHDTGGLPTSCPCGPHLRSLAILANSGFLGPVVLAREMPG